MRKKAAFEGNSKGCLWHLLKYFSIFLCLCIAYVGFMLFARKDACVRLSNGYMIGHPAIFHRNKDIVYEMVLRNAEGEILLKTDDWIRFHRHLTNPDIVILEYADKRLEMPGHAMMELIFDQERHNRKWNEPKKGYPNHTSLGLIDLYSVLKKLTNSKEFRSNGCKTPWFVQ